MTFSFKEAFDYHHHFNQKLIHQLKEVQDKLPARTIPLFSHVIGAHTIWLCRIYDLPAPGVHDVYPLDGLKKLDEENHEKTIALLAEENPDRIISYKNSKGSEFNNSVKDILFHIINHSTHHKGQIISDIRAAGFDPVVTDYIFYKR